jgi:dTDP-4-dehydrorhamnose reductase
MTPTDTRILLTGATGQVGHELRPRLSTLGKLIPATRRVLDLAELDVIAATLDAIAPNVIVNAAGFTAVDNAERDHELCHRVNAEATKLIAEWAAKHGALLVHYSSDYVFDGNHKKAYTESDATGPINVYGASKLAGERAIAASGAAHLIFRTSWVYGAHGSNFARTMLRLAHQRTELGVVDDQCGTPTWAGRVAAVTAEVLAQLITPDQSPIDALGDRGGVYHCTAKGSTSWYHFAEQVIAHDPKKAEQTLTALSPITTAEFPTPAARPKYSVLSSAKLTATWGVTLPKWETDLVSVMPGLEPTTR